VSNDLELSPRPVAPRKPARTGGRKWAPIAILVLVLGAGGIIVTQFLRSAVDYYCNVDELGVRDGCDANRRLRVQGVVDEGSVEFAAGYTQFTMSFGGEELDVRYRGQPTGMFAECEPVVVHGRIGDDGVLAGDNIEVKHSNEYVAENPGRVDGAGPSCPVADAAADV
jgi:cytochrome c-type biogenesis protein CcmE